MLGGQTPFLAIELLLREGTRFLLQRTVSVAGLLDWVQDNCPTQLQRAKMLLHFLQRPRLEFSGLSLRVPQIMAIVNVTPDSFSDGRTRLDPAVAVRDAIALWEAGATILDIGGESTRPGAEPVSEDEELRRVIPVIEGLRAAKIDGLRLSIDTRHARVMRAAVDAGADIINDVCALMGKGALETAVQCGVPVILMHMQGTPQTMQQHPHYDNVVLDVYDALERRVEACVQAGLARDLICVDPGIGFGKTRAHNVQLLDRQAVLQGLGCPVLLGVSRKSFIDPQCGPQDRLPGSLACVLDGWGKGTRFFRVHDVAETAQALRIFRAINEIEFDAE